MKRTSRLLPLLLTLVLLSGILIGVLHWQSIFDWWRLRNYQPPARISALAQNTTMTDKARRLFYVYRPSLADKSTFAQHCQSYEQSIVLGCYSQINGIYIYDVPDERLKGVHEVTAAHEMLHAAYDRLSTKEKHRIDALTAQAFANVNNERIKNAVDSYRQRSSDIVPNELHSIMATEVLTLPPELETYYQQYFKDRSHVVNYSETYEAVFSERKQKVADFDARLVDLRAEIDAAEKALTSQEAALNQERSRIDGLLAANQYSQYNAAVGPFNKKVQTYNALISSTESKIDQYNMLVQERNAIAVEEQDLMQALDSRIKTIK